MSEANTTSASESIVEPPDNTVENDSGSLDYIIQTLTFAAGLVISSFGVYDAFTAYLDPSQTEVGLIHAILGLLVFTIFGAGFIAIGKFIYRLKEH